MALEYLREYFHVASSYEISESIFYRNIKWIDDTRIQHPDFALSARKAWLKSELDYEVVLIDATETPIERPKKEQRIRGVQIIATTKKEVLFIKKEKA